MDNREVSSLVLAVSGGVGGTKETIELSWLVKLLLAFHPHLFFFFFFFKVPRALAYAVLRAKTYTALGVRHTLPKPAGSSAAFSTELGASVVALYFVFSSCP